MENNIDKYFRKLSEEQNPKSFPSMDKIWENVEEKLDEKKKKRIVPIWKYTGVAASLLLLITLGSRFISQKDSQSETTDIVLIDEDKIKEEFDSLQNSEDVVAFENAEQPKDKVHKAVKRVPPVITKKDNVSSETTTMSDDISTKEKSGSDFSFTYKMVDESKTDTEIVMSANSEGAKEVSKKESVSSKTITGNIISKDDGLPLPGATVMVPGTTNGVQTDLDGNFSIQVEEGQELEISYLGMEKQNLLVGRANQFNVALVNDSMILETVGYSSFEKKYPHQTAATTTVSAKDIESYTTTGVVTDSKNGLPLAGVNVRVLGTERVITTDSYGKYSIKAKKGDKLEFSSNGIKTKVVKVKKSNVVDVKLLVL